MDDKQLMIDSYFNRKSPLLDKMINERIQSSSIIPMIKEFDLIKLMSNVPKDDFYDNGGFVVITDHQYIVGYNLEYGMRSHELSYACITGELLKGGETINPSNCVEEFTLCNNAYLTGRINCEQHNMDISFTLSEREDRDHPFVLKKITNGQLEAFKAFYDEYNDTIKRYRLPVSLGIPKNGTVCTAMYEDLTPMLELMETMVDNNKEIPEADGGEKIIGVSNKTIHKRRVLKRSA